MSDNDSKDASGTFMSIPKDDDNSSAKDTSNSLAV
jgi:hypothetical protein